MKVAINKSDLGPFELSHLAIEKYFIDKFILIWEQDNWLAYKFEDFSEEILCKKQPFHCYMPYEINNSKKFRAHPLVIRAIEELKEKDGVHIFCEPLKIVEIPFDTLEGWTIMRVNYKEYIEEICRRWY